MDIATGLGLLAVGCRPLHAHTHGRRFADVSRCPCGDRDFWRLLRRHTYTISAFFDFPRHQALQEKPEIAEASEHIMVEETKQGLNIENVDQDGRSMFPAGGKEPYERTRKLLQKIAP